MNRISDNYMETDAIEITDLNSDSNQLLVVFDSDSKRKTLFYSEINEVPTSPVIM